MRPYFSVLILICLILNACESGQEQTAGTQISDSIPEEQLITEKPIILIENSDSLALVLESSLDSLFIFCQKQKIQEAASRMLYSGRNKKRRWKDIMNPSAPKERTDTEKTCMQIRVLLETSSHYTFSRLFIQPESEGSWYVCEIIFYRDDGTESNKQFAFLPVHGKYCLGDIH